MRRRSPSGAVGADLDESSSFIGNLVGQMSEMAAVIIGLEQSNACGPIHNFAEVLTLTVLTIGTLKACWAFTKFQHDGSYRLRA